MVMWIPCREEVARLTEDGVDIIIALGHSGYDKGTVSLTSCT